MIVAFEPGILGWVLCDHSAKTFQPLWELVVSLQYYFYVTDEWLDVLLAVALVGRLTVNLLPRSS